MAKSKKKQQTTQSPRVGLLRAKRGAKKFTKTFWQSNVRSGKHLKSPYGSNYSDRVPYKTDAITRDAIFEGRGDNIPWRYFTAPRGVQVDMTSGATENQIPLLDMVRDFARDLDKQEIASSDRAIKRGFHLQMTRKDMRAGVPYPEGTAAAQKDYLDRCNTNRPLANYSLNAGFRLELLNTAGQEFSVNEMIKEGAKQALYRSESVREQLLSRYMQDSRRVEEIVTDAGFEPIDFADPKINPNDSKFHELTSWMCNDDTLLENSSIALPLYGTSAILPRFDEVAFYAVTMKDQHRHEGRYYTPSSYRMKYAREFFRPENSVVHVSIRGEILSMKHTQLEMTLSEDGAFQDQMDEMSQEDIKLSSIRNVGEKRDLATAAAVSARYNPLITDCFTIIGVRTYEGEEPPIVTRLRKDYDMDVVPVTGNVDDALHATLPGFNKPIFTNGRQRFWNTKSKRVSQRVFPGMVFMNGIFNSSVPPVKDGIYAGVMNSFQEYKPFFINPKQIADGTVGENNPGVLITGRPGAGKTVELKQFAKQLENNNNYCALFNFKSVEPIAPWWQEVMSRGVVVNIDETMLANNRGCMDAFNFYDRATEMTQISNTISEAIFMLWEENQVVESSGKYRPNKTGLDSAVTDRVRNPYAQCAGDVIFGTGNKAVREEFYEVEDEVRRRGGDLQEVIREFALIASEHDVVPPLPYKEVRTMVMDAIDGSSHPFWKAFVSLDGRANRDMADAILSGSPILFEWGENFTPPASGVSRDQMTASEFDATLSALVALGYVRRAAARFQKSTGRGGAIMVDEAAGAMNIPQFNAEIERIVREFRVIGMRIILGTQRLTDVKSNIHSFISLYIMGAISNGAHSNSANSAAQTEDELSLFYNIIDAEPADYEARREFILSAARTDEDDGGDIATRATIRHTIPYAWVVDKINRVNGPLMMGEFPIKELTGGMTREERRMLSQELEESSWQDEKIIRTTMGG